MTVAKEHPRRNGFRGQLCSSRYFALHELRRGGMTNLHDLADASGVLLEHLEGIDWDKVAKLAERHAKSLPKDQGAYEWLQLPVFCTGCCYNIKLVPCVACLFKNTPNQYRPGRLSTKTDE